MVIEEAIMAAFRIGTKAIPQLIEFVKELRDSNPPTPEEEAAIWARHKVAFDTIMAEDPSTHPQG